MVQSISQLRVAVARCQDCDLYQTRRNVVLGDERDGVTIMLLGEAPGGKEDETGIPFAADAGKELNRFLDILGITRNQIYIGNAVKCRPTVPSERARYNGYRNRKPTVKEIKACSHWLEQEIAFLKPKLIVTLGGVPLQRLLQDYRLKVGDYRGKVFYHPEYKCDVFPLYHPASVIYDRKKSVIYEEDLVKLKKFIEEKSYK